MRVVEPPGLGIDGVQLVPLTSHQDDRGSVTEVYRRSWTPGVSEMVQGNLSISRAGVLRGLHFHRKQADYWFVVSGMAFIGLYDLRVGSPSEGRKAEIRLSADEQRSALYIPKGVAHGFYAETDLVLQYLVDQYFAGEDEFGIAWDDPEVGIEWPGRHPVLSERDRRSPTLASVRERAPAF
ncbi:MAG: dTDP-4-dehydrorhamnose 3,5-epimerase family protein [Actinomycetota bacterium]